MARRSSAKNEIQDPSLPQKKRARWRLIGATVLALAALIILPFALESEPKRQLGDVAVRMPARTEIGKMQSVWPRNDIPSKGGMILEPEKPRSGGGVVTGAAAAIGATAAATGVAANKGLEQARPAATPTAAAVQPDTKIMPPPVVSKPVPVPTVRQETPKEAPKVAKKDASKPVAQPQAEPKKTPKKTADPRKAANKETDKLAKLTKKLTAKAPPIPARRTDPNQVKAASPSGYVVQIGAFSTQRGARAQVARGKKLGFNPYTEKIKTSKGDRIRVRIGPYLTRQQADDARKKLKRAGVDTALIAP